MGTGSTYETAITGLAAGASTYAPGGGLTWNITFWHPGDATPNLSNFNVLVTQSSVSFTNNYSGILNSESAIQSARGSRTFITGQDADYHYIYGPGPVDNGPRGFLIDAVDWAGSGTGLGVVDLQGDGWELNSNSFLASTLSGYTYGYTGNNVVIPSGSTGYPVNAGLTSAGLSNWNESYHEVYSKPVPGYTSINDSGDYSGYAVTILTQSEASGGTTGSVAPLPATAWAGLVLLGGLGMIVGCRHRRATSETA